MKSGPARRIFNFGPVVPRPGGAIIKRQLWCAVALGLAGCGRPGVSYVSASDKVVGPSDATFTIGLTQFSPATATVPINGRVTFLNLDSRPHPIVSDASGGQPLCPELDGPPIPPQSHFTFIMAGHAELCGFHDLLGGRSPVGTPDSDLALPLVQGTLVVAAPGAGGGSGSTGAVVH